ncbi:MAG TPA: transglutaminase-like domain-containing protein [Alphaproteobacteria bacterium]|nr:transglutaminase-like domain-containing protein [Alphaproteobacteria bacterium]
MGSGEADPRAYLRGLAERADSEIDLPVAALALAALDRPHVSLERYCEHLTVLSRDVSACAKKIAPDEDTLARRIATLNEVIYGGHGYRGDSLNYDDIQNANLIRVIDRRRGLPVALGILYIHAARSQGWEVAGINFPAHFMVRLQHRGQRAIIDPFNEGTVREVAELREMLKTSHGQKAELDPSHYAAVGNRAILLRLQNNLKLRLMQGGDNERALAVVESMLLFAPGEFHLWHDCGMLHAKIGNLRSAIAALETFLARVKEDGPRHHAATLLQQIRTRLN